MIDREVPAINPTQLAEPVAKRSDPGRVLLRNCPQVTILATSREPLRVVGELCWPVPPLSLASSSSAEQSLPGEAEQLFVDRARAVQPGFDGGAASRGVVSEICARLDGLPLAIELAAARIGSIPVRELLHRLGSAPGGLQLLAHGPRDAPARQRTLRATIAWSYDLLTANERALFRRLGPFRGCSLEAVDAVCISGTPGPRRTSLELATLNMEPRDALEALVTRNLLQVEQDDQGHAWYRMLETVREFALERLEASPEGAAVWRRHA
jgi:predicted ATPase